ncbi:MAG: pilus (MSHA type) biogenesis protein MshL [Magnetococcales bacterium]|nr:pilus (MSHA type) biogenesis protein MshL [Magnetococcales bacterium]
MIKLWHRVGLALLLTGLSTAVIGCAGSQPSAVQHMADNVLDGAINDRHASRKTLNLSSKMADALLTPLNDNNLEIVAESQLEKPFDITVDQAQIRPFLNALVAETDINIMVHPDVSGVISLSLKNVTVPEVMDAVCSLYGYDCQEVEKGYQIFPRRIQTVNLRLNYPNFRRSGSSSTQVTSGGGLSTETDTSDSSGTRVTTEYGNDFWDELTRTLCVMLGLNAQQVDSEYMNSTVVKRTLACVPTSSQTDTQAQQPQPVISAANAKGGDVAAQLSSALSGAGVINQSEQQAPAKTRTVSMQQNSVSQQSTQKVLNSDSMVEERGVSVSPQSGLVMIRAFPSEIRRITHYLDDLQESLRRQVVLEAKILEVTLSDGFQSGINWASLGRSSKNGRALQAGMTGSGEFIDLDNPSALNLTSGYFATNNSGLPAIPFTGFGGAFSAALSFKDFNAFIELLQSQGDVQVLSSPRISTLNNQKALIKVGNDDFYVTGIDVETDDNGNEQVNTTFTPFFSGVALDVVAQIDGDDTLTLHIHPAVTEVTEKRKVVRGEEYDLASSTTRESDSVVSARSGEIVVIGGLMKTEQQNASNGVPVLSELPLFGSLFSQVDKTVSKSELVILMRPTVIGKSRDAWKNDLKAMRKRIKESSRSKGWWRQ